MTMTEVRKPADGDGEIAEPACEQARWMPTHGLGTGQLRPRIGQNAVPQRLDEYYDRDNRDYAARGRPTLPPLISSVNNVGETEDR